MLRPGIIGLSEIKKIVRKISTSSNDVKLKAPGMMKRHYSPGIPVIIGKKQKNLKDAFIVFGRKYKIFRLPFHVKFIDYRLVWNSF